MTAHCRCHFHRPVCAPLATIILGRLRDEKMRTRKRKKQYKHLFGYVTRQMMSGRRCDNTLRLTHEFAEMHDKQHGGE